MSPEAVAALVGAAGGWVLGFGTDMVRTERELRRQRKVAAQLVYAELVINMATVIAFRDSGSWSSNGMRRHAWDSHASALLHRAKENRVVRLARAYSALEDVQFLAEHPEPTSPIAQLAYLNDSLEIVNGGLKVVSSLAGVRGAPDAIATP
jgi:hypothetical protein